MPDSVLNQIGTWLFSLVVTGFVAGGGAYGLFLWLGKRWVTAQFDRDLAAFKAEKDKELEELRSGYQAEIERLRAEIARLMDRATKLHEHEYQVLPELWGLLKKAQGEVARIVNSFQQHPDLDRMEEKQLEDFLQRSDLPEWQADKLRASAAKTADYAKMITSIRLGTANAAVVEYNNYVLLHGIFIDDGIRSKCSLVSAGFQRALLHRTHVERGLDANGWDKAQDAFGETDDVSVEIEAAIRQRMFDVRLPS